MELYQELLLCALKKEKMQVIFPDLNIEAEKIIEMKCYQILHQIKEILSAEWLNDEECVMRIEEILHLFYENKIDVGNRHD